MRFAKSFAIFLFLSVSASASTLPNIETLIHDKTARIAIQNSGGLVHMGVCWWHSRLQRNFWYLARFNETAPKPTEEEASQLIRSLIKADQIVIIPGFGNVLAFTSYYDTQVQAQLNGWQARDAFMKQAWTRTLATHSHLPSDQMKVRMDSIYDRFQAAQENNEILWLMLKMKGLVAHSSLLIDMQKTEDGGYYLEMVDSNFPDGEVQYDYHPGDKSISPFAPMVNEHYSSVPYVGFQKDLDRIEHALEL